VGYFSPQKAASVGRSVSVGDVLGWVDVLGVRQDVVAPSDGIVGRILAEPGEAVEYGQALVRIDVAASAAADGAAATAAAEASAAALAAEAPPVERDTTSSLSGPRSGALD
jgi:multidrug efflux pump subunit AcrA (membrane-fusion protein)